MDKKNDEVKNKRKDELDKEFEVLMKRYNSVVVRLYDAYMEKHKDATTKDFIKDCELSESEEDIKELMHIHHVNAKRDKTRYFFINDIYLKNKLVLAVVKQYVEDNKGCTINDLERIFPKSIQGSIGVVKRVEEAQARSDFSKRFFTKEQDIIHLTDGDMYVCSEWSIKNIKTFIFIAEKYGYKIEEIYELY